jgi:acyl-CoA synthetase (AMP-forming)/AMP-acid ligase II
MAFTSDAEPVSVGGATFPALCTVAAARAPAAPALIDGPSGQVVSHGLLARRVERVAAGLAARGFARGDVLALWAPNVPPWAGVALGAMAAGGAVTGIHPGCTEPELAAQLADSGASVLVTVPSLLPSARAGAAAAGVREVVVLGEGDAATPIAALLDEAAPPARPQADPADVALLPYSSGTTGAPKAVALAHAQLVTAVRQINRGLAFGPGDVVSAVAPFCHVMGFVVVLGGALAGGAAVLTVPRFELEAFLAMVERERATVLVVAPPVMAALARDPRVGAYDLSSVQLVVSGGAPLGAELQRAVAARLPGVVTGQGWGLTETAAVGTLPDRRRGTVPGSVGRIPANGELRVVEPATGRDLGPGQDGELWIRGPQVMSGYRGRPAATAEILGADGWLRSGDLGRIDADGDVFVVDRLKELIKVSAEQVAPAELEALLLTHPGVADAAVVPRPDPDRGEVPVAVVVARDGLDDDELMAWVAARVAPFKRIRAVRRTEVLPRSPAGKLLRRALVEAERAGYAGASASSGTASASSETASGPGSGAAGSAGAASSASAGPAPSSAGPAPSAVASGAGSGAGGLGSERSETANSSRAR